MTPRLVIALGGNALGNTPQAQEESIARVTDSLVELIARGYEIVVTHGNGPQVGMIQLAFSETARKNERIPEMPLPESTAMSQGYIGYHLQSGLTEALRRRGFSYQAVTVVTRVEVDRADAAFRNPTKPIGSFYSKEEAQAQQARYPGSVFGEDAGRGYRRMVASPRPCHIVEIEAVKALLYREFIVIACGGGGIPVVRDANGTYTGVDAVVDKDFAGEKLAEEVDAAVLLILTAVDGVSLHYGTPAQQSLTRMSTAEAQRYCRDGHFAPGSMLPKVEAAIAFAESGQGRRAIITSPQAVLAAMEGKAGTLIFGGQAEEKHPEFADMRR